jgi:hypothetical protein
MKNLTKQQRDLLRATLRELGRQGGKASARKLTARERTERARRAGRAGGRGRPKAKGGKR